jgi:hypothetical protein
MSSPPFQVTQAQCWSPTIGVHSAVGAVEVRVPVHIHALARSVAPVDVAGLDVVPVDEDNAVPGQLDWRAANNTGGGQARNQLTLGGGNRLCETGRRGEGDKEDGEAGRPERMGNRGRFAHVNDSWMRTLAGPVEIATAHVGSRLDRPSIGHRPGRRFDDGAAC